ncbi:PucR family transcriptional regulator [Streptomyces sp. NPDC001276]|uniref:PucR family transcriptional regulator n=1 Tax=Streptomyces sp. NPDC001276 TaxID=3364555 RepID=UPI0036A5153B
MPPTRNITVRMLLGERHLGLKIVNEGNLDRRVRGAHSVEIESAGKWLRQDWLMLTTGLRFVGLPDAERQQDELVKELVQCRAAALLFGIGVHFQDVPPTLRRAAEAARLNLLTVDPSVPFLQVEQYVYESELSSDAYLLRQRLRIQEDLLEALAADQPIKALVHRIGALTHGTAILYEESGRVVESTGQGPTVLIWSAVRAGSSHGGQHGFTVGRWHVTARPVALRGVGYWIAIASRREQVIDELGQPILDATQKLLGAMRGLRTLTLAQSVTEAAEILRTIRSGMTPDTASRIWDRLRPFRFERNRTMRAFVAVPKADQDTSRGDGPAPAHPDPRDVLLETAQTFGLPLVLEADETDGFSGLAGDRVVLDDWLRVAARTHHVGLSEPFEDLNLARARTRDAERALRVAMRGWHHRFGAGTAEKAGQPGSILRFEDVDLVTWLLASRSVDAVAAKARQQLGHLLTRDDLTTTVVTYLNCDQDVRATAQAMFLHPNSVRYRLRRVEELLGAPITSTVVVANLYLALHDRMAEPRQSQRDEGDAPGPDSSRGLCGDR